MGMHYKNGILKYIKKFFFEKKKWIKNKKGNNRLIKKNIYI